MPKITYPRANVNHETEQARLSHFGGHPPLVCPPVSRAASEERRIKQWIEELLSDIREPLEQFRYNLKNAHEQKGR